MDTQEKKAAGFGNPIVNLILTGIVFVFWVIVLRDFVPARTQLVQWIFSAFTAIPLTGVFYFALNMFRVVLNDHNQSKAE